MRRESRKSVTLLCVLAAVLCLAGDTWAEAGESGQQAVAGTNTRTAWNLFATGGPLMYPLAACSCVVLGLIVHQALEVRAGRMLPAADREILRQLVYQGDLGGARSYCEQNRNFLTTAIAAGIVRLNAEKPDYGVSAAETAIMDTIDSQETRMSFWLNMISVIAAVSPMIGLLGTVSGMIKAFQKIGMGGMGKPEQLAGNIGEALITTATGLIVGIPAMLAFFIFRGRLDALLASVNEACTELLDIGSGAGHARQAYEERRGAAVYQQAPGQMPLPAGSGQAGGYQAPAGVPPVSLAAQPQPADRR